MCAKKNNPTTNVLSCKIYCKVGFKNFGSLQKRKFKVWKEHTS